MRVAALTLLFALAFGGAALAAPPNPPPSGTSPCSRAETRAAVGSFFTAFAAGEFVRLDSLFAPEPAFQWYSTPAPGRRLGGASHDRESLIPYLRRRHDKGDRLRLDTFHWSGRSPHWSNFWLEGRRSTPALHGGDWFRADAKGAVVCEGGAARLIVLTFGARQG